MSIAANIERILGPRAKGAERRECKFCRCICPITHPGEKAAEQPRGQAVSEIQSWFRLAIAQIGRDIVRPSIPLLTTLALLVTGLCHGQEALRYSWAAASMTEAQRQLPSNQPYTFKTGDFRLLVTPSVEQNYNDNVNLAKTGSQSDFILKPFLQTSGSYPITAQNLLTFSAGIGYDEYLEHSYYSGFRVNSTSQLMFDMKIKDFLINFHDRIRFYEDPGLEPSLAGTAGTAGS